MRIEIEKIIQQLPLSGYAEQYGETALQVWVNPARKIMLERIEQINRGDALRAELDELRQPGESAPDETAIERARAILAELNELGKKSLAWMAEILSQGPEETQMSLADLEAFVQDCEESDPGLYRWIYDRVWWMINDYRSLKKKA